MLELSQVILGVRDLEAASRRMEALGLTVLEGGVHPGLGTANRIIPLGRAYLELLGVVDPALAAGNWYGQALLAQLEHGDRLVRWSLRTDDIDAVGARLGLTPEPRSRVRPDGVRLTWRAAGLQLSMQRPGLPFFMQWDDPALYPGLLPAVHAAAPTGVAWLELAVEEVAQLSRFIEGAQAPLRVVAGRPGLRRVALATPRGEMVIGG